LTGKVYRLGLTSLLVLLAACVLGAGLAPKRVGVVEIRHWSYANYTRVVVELDGPVETTVKRLAPDSSADRPERLYLDLPGVWVGRRYAQPISVADGLLEEIRLGQYTMGVSRLVLDLSRYDHHRSFVLSGPDRVVVDVYGSRDPSQRHLLGADLPIGLREVRSVVIDPGHGGRDPGAIGIGGVLEKDLTLKVGLELRRRLAARGFQVLMTRDSDRTVSLEERTALAEGRGADVFVSLHVNASPRPAARGIETFVLDTRYQRHALRLAARENGVKPRDLDDLQRAMAGLRMTEVYDHASDLAALVHGSLLEGVRKVYGSTEDLGVRPAPFHVLFLSSAPSVLVEMGFLTNRHDVRRLRNRLYQAVVAEQIARALSHYRAERAIRLARSAP